MAKEPAASNGHYATKAEHETLRDLVEGIRVELARQGREQKREGGEQKEQGKTLQFLESQAKLNGQALELLVLDRGLDLPKDPEDPDDD